MGTIERVTIIAVLVLLTSCASTTKFSVSQAAPAADITATTQKQGAPNYLVTITANNLADSKRLNPPKEIYIIWAVSEADIVRNVGHFTQKNAITSTYKASFPYKPVEIFITAEDEEGLCVPAGTEISRAKL